MKEAVLRWRKRGAIRRDRPRWTMLTFTVRSGGVVADRAALQRAWQRWRGWLHQRIGAFPYVGVWECTDGREGQGHVHLHVLAPLGWVDYAAVHDEWERATEGRGRVVDVQRVRSTRGAARYLAKYVTKGVTASTAVLARWTIAQYGRRSYTASRGWWRGVVDGCCEGAGYDVWLEPGTGETLVFSRGVSEYRHPARAGPSAGRQLRMLD